MIINTCKTILNDVLSMQLHATSELVIYSIIVSIVMILNSIINADRDMTVHIVRD